MRKCPSCGKDIEDNPLPDYCPECGNPFGDERPWDKVERKANPFLDEMGNENDPHVRHQQRGASNTRSRYMATQEKEYYLKNEFVVKTGFCGYTVNPDDPEDLKEGTCIITKNLLLFGNSDHAIRCGKFIIEIPLDAVEYVTDGYYKSKPAFEIHINTGEIFMMFVRKKADWVDYFRYVLDYRPNDHIQWNDEPDEDIKHPFMFRWGRMIMFILLAIGFLIWGFYSFGILRYVCFFITACCLIMTAVAIFAPDKLQHWGK